MIPTPHIEAKAGDIADTVLMPGDPLRAKFIADNFLADCHQFNAVRGMLGFTGFYQGARVSVMGSGMGIPSMGIYAYELFKFYDVQKIIRVGTAGGIGDCLKLRDIVIAMAASTDSNFLRQYGIPGNFAPVANFALVERAVAAARAARADFVIGNILSSDTFYGDDPTAMAAWKKMGILAVEMEAAALYATAARLNRAALAILTISDMIFTHEATSSAEREKSFTQMMEIALNAATD